MEFETPATLKKFDQLNCTVYIDKGTFWLSMNFNSLTNCIYISKSILMGVVFTLTMLSGRKCLF